MANLVLRRGLGVRDYSVPPKVAEEPKRFSDLARGDYFYLYPPAYIGLTFIKTHNTGAQLDDPSNDSAIMDQYFPPDTMVYPIVYTYKKP